MIGSSNRLLRNRHVSPGQVRMLQTLWSTRLRRAGRRLRPERSRAERLEHIAEIVGHAVTSSKDLSWREANRVIHRLLEEVRAEGLSPSGGLPAAPEAEGSPAEVSATASSGGPPSDALAQAGPPNLGRNWTRAFRVWPARGLPAGSGFGGCHDCAILQSSAPAR